MAGGDKAARRRLLLLVLSGAVAVMVVSGVTSALASTAAQTQRLRKWGQLLKESAQVTPLAIDGRR